MAFSLNSEQKENFLWIGLGIFLIVLTILLGPILTPFVTAIILAYVLHPGVDWLTRKRIGKFRIPRIVAVIIVFSIFILAILAVVLIILPLIIQELPLLQEQIPNFLSKINDAAAPILHKFNISTDIDLNNVKQFLTQKVVSNSEEIWSSVFASAKTGGAALISVITNLLFIPMVLFYLLEDWHKFVRMINRVIPIRVKENQKGIVNEVNHLMGQYLHGQLLVMIILAVYYSIALKIAGFNIALPVGTITGLLVFIPYVGYGLGLVLAIMAGILQFDGWYGLICVAIIYGIGQVLEGFILTPRLVGERIGLHPLVVIFALLAFGQLFGFVGILLALPASAIIAVIVRHVFEYYQNSSFYNRKS